MNYIYIWRIGIYYYIMKYISKYMLRVYYVLIFNQNLLRILKSYEKNTFQRFIVLKIRLI